MPAVKLPALMLALAAGLASAGKSSAQDALYHVSWIKNDTNVKATIFYKWGNGAWGKYVIQPNSRAYFPYALNGANGVSPKLTIRYDADLSNGAKYVEYELSRGGSPDKDQAQFGHHFKIAKSTPTSNIRLISDITQGATSTLTDANAVRPNVP